LTAVGALAGVGALVTEGVEGAKLETGKGVLLTTIAAGAGAEVVAPTGLLVALVETAGSSRPFTPQPATNAAAAVRVERRLGFIKGKKEVGELGMAISDRRAGLWI
jgi:hypothetical protein